MSDTYFSIHSIYEIILHCQIIHKIFGKGEVIQISDNDSQMVVNFENMGKKTLILKYAQIIIL